MRTMERDIEIFRGIGKYGFLTVPVIGWRFGMNEKRVYRRLDAWRKAGLAGHRRLYREYAGAVFLTAKGCRVAGLKIYREPSLQLVSYRHELGVMNLGIELEVEGKGQVMTERELRARQAEGESWSVPLAGRHSASRWPDLVLTDSRDSIAIELELAAKRSARLAEIIDGYERCPTYREVRFVVDQGAVAERIARIGSGWRPGSKGNAPIASKLKISAWSESTEYRRVAEAGAGHEMACSALTLKLEDESPLESARRLLEGSR